MNLEQAVGNIDIVLQNAQMKRVEHEQVFNDLNLLVARAQLADKLEQELKEAKELISRMSAPPQDIDVPEVPDENQADMEVPELVEKVD